jgi:hypothetical protein
MRGSAVQQIAGQLAHRRFTREFAMRVRGIV